MRIQGYQFGRIVIDGKSYASDLLLWPEGVDDSWWRRSGHDLSAEDLAALADKDLDALVVGRGASGVMQVSDETLRRLEEQFGEVHAVPTRQACEILNRLAESGRRVGAALHLTC